MKKEYAYCGYDCNECKIKIATVQKDLKQIKEIIKSDEDVAKLFCKGCKSNVVSAICEECFIKQCNEENGLSSCSLCDEFPCSYIKKYLSKESLMVLENLSKDRLYNRCAIIGMCGNSCFYDIKDERVELVHEEVGGKGYNQAVAVLRNGTKVSFLAAVGNDKNGDLCEDFMKNEGADCFFIRKEKPTLEANIYVDKDGNNTVKYSQNNVAKLTKDDVINFKNEIAKSDILLLQYEYDYEVIQEAISIAKKYNVKVVVNPAPMIYSDINLIKDADIITPNEVEANALFNICGKNSLNLLIKKEQESFFKLVINTLGSNGVMSVDKEKVINYKPIKVQAVDTTGAGDTFNGVFVASLCQGIDLDTSIRRAVIGSGLSVKKKYVMDAIPNKKDIDEYIEKELK